MDELLQITPYGFEWGPMVIERATSHNGHVVLTLKTDKQIMNIRVTPAGLIRPGEIRKRKSTD